MRLVMSSVSVSIRESTSAPPTKWRGDKGRPQPTGPLAIFCVRWSNSVRFTAWYLERCWPREFGRTVERPLPPFLASVTAGIVPNHSAFRKRNRSGCHRRRPLERSESHQPRSWTRPPSPAQSLVQCRANGDHAANCSGSPKKPLSLPCDTGSFASA
jgi:hypothetical protein